MKNKLNEAFDNVDDELIEKTAGAPKKSKALRIAVTAAALAAVMIVSFAVGAFLARDGKSGIIDDTGWIPSTTVDPFKGESGKYDGVKFLCLADASTTAKMLYDTATYYNKIDTYRQYAENLDKFFDKLTQWLMDDDENAVVSPVNIYMALSLLAECTSGSSRGQILEVLGVDSVEELREQSKLIWLYNSKNDEFGKSVMGNSIWLSSDLPVKEQCVNYLKDDHYASTFTGNFKDVKFKNSLKQWLSDQTYGLLDNCINELEIPDSAAAVLASTLYYKTSWRQSYFFNEDGTFTNKNGKKSCTFNKKKMVNESIYEGNGFTAYCEYLSDDNAIWFFLPDKNKTAADVLKTDLVSYIRGDLSGEKYDVIIRMPDFDVSYNKQIKEALNELGVADCMDPDKADFSALSDDDLFLSSVVHAARFKADKDGVEGAAFTEMVAEATGEIVKLKDYDFTLDRPFVFMVANQGVPLFTGVVNEI